MIQFTSRKPQTHGAHYYTNKADANHLLVLHIYLTIQMNSLQPRLTQTVKATLTIVI